MSSQGERGKQGDHGQIGDTGDRGFTGRTGGVGATGDQGVRGRTGRQGRSFSRAQVGAVFGFVTIAFLALAFGLTHQANVQHRAIVFECQQQNRSVMAINRVLESLADFARQSTTLTPAERDARLRLYTDNQMVPVDCKHFTSVVTK